MASFFDCLTKFNQLVLLVVNIFVLLLGLSVMIVGAWAEAQGREYFTITDDESDYTNVAILLIVVGIFVFIIGVVGAVGALFASKVFGRIILMVYAIGLGLLVICEVAGGIAAAAARDQLAGVFRDSVNSTFQNYLNNTSERDAWNDFQKRFECCGVKSYKDYRALFHDNSVPLSCCNGEARNATGSGRIDCSIAVKNVTDSAYVYSKGCSDALADAIGKNLGAIAGAAIVLALIQIVGVVMACCVALYPKKETYEVV